MNSAGHIYTPRPSLSRGYSRTTLSSHPIEGVSDKWLYDKELTFNASVGQIGLFKGRDSQGFAIERGTLASAGRQIKLSGALIGEETPHSALALQMLQAQDAAAEQRDNAGRSTIQLCQWFWALPN